MNLNDLLSEYLGLTVADLRGTALAGSVPLTNAVINTLIARKLASAQLPVVSVKVDAQSGDSLIAEVATRTPLFPVIRVSVVVERQPVWPDDPVLHLRWTLVGMGALSAFAGPLLAVFKNLPAGVSVSGDRVAVNLREVLRSRGLGDLAEALRELELRTQPGIAVVRFSVGV